MDRLQRPRVESQLAVLASTLCTDEWQLGSMYCVNSVKAMF